MTDRSQRGGHEATAARPKLTEKQWQATVMDALNKTGWKSYHSWLSIRSTPGFPDIIAIRGDRLLAIELKAEWGNVSPAQQHWLEVFAGAGVEAYVWRPSDWLDVERVLQP